MTLNQQKLITATRKIGGTVVKKKKGQLAPVPTEETRFAIIQKQQKHANSFLVMNQTPSVDDAFHSHQHQRQHQQIR